MDDRSDVVVEVVWGFSEEVLRAPMLFDLDQSRFQSLLNVKEDAIEDIFDPGGAGEF